MFHVQLDDLELFMLTYSSLLHNWTWFLCICC